MSILFYLLLCSFVDLHDVQVAYYKIRQDDHNITVNFVFELEDMLASLGVTKTSISEISLQHYLKENFSLEINSDLQSLSYGEIQFSAKHILLEATLSTPEQVITSVTIGNTCLLDLEGHSNIIEIRLRGQERDFLMNSKRTSINIDY